MDFPEDLKRDAEREKNAYRDPNDPNNPLWEKEDEQS